MFVFISPSSGLSANVRVGTCLVSRLPPIPKLILPLVHVSAKNNVTIPHLESHDLSLCLVMRSFIPSNYLLSMVIRKREAVISSTRSMINEGQPQPAKAAVPSSELRETRTSRVS